MVMVEPALFVELNGDLDWLLAPHPLTTNKPNTPRQRRAIVFDFIGLPRFNMQTLCICIVY